MWLKMVLSAHMHSTATIAQMGLRVYKSRPQDLCDLFTLQIMDTIKGTMTEIYNDLSKSTSGNTIAEVTNVTHFSQSSL